MTGLFFFLAMFPAMLYTARQGTTIDREAALQALAAPPTWEEAEDLFWLLVSGLFALVSWPFRLLWRGALAVSRFDLAEWICKVTGAGFDPEAGNIEWPEKAAAKPFKIIAEEYVQADGEGFAIYDGVIYSNGKMKDRPQSETPTTEELAALQNSDPPLRNLTLAMDIKRHLLAGKTDYEIAVLVGKGQSYVKQHRLAFEKAKNGG